MKNKQYTLLLLAATTCAITAIAQPRIKYQRVLGSNNHEHFSSMELTKDGGYILGGNSNSGISGQKTENNRGLNDYWIVKIDKYHKIQWDKTIGGKDQDNLRRVQQTTDGGYILGGQSSSNISGEKSENSRGVIDYWIVKLDSNRNVQWDKTIGTYSGDILTDVQQTADGGYIVGGYSSANISGEKTENHRGASSDYWIVKLDASGNIQWDKTIGGSSHDELYALQQTVDGGYILGGRSSSNTSYEKTQNKKGKFDFWVVKLDSNRNIQWDKTIGGSDNDELMALQQTLDGSYILAGTSSSNISGDKSENRRGDLDYDNWIVKINSSGRVQWDKTIGGSSPDNVNSIQQTTDGGFIVGGTSSSNISGEKTENSRGGEDYWIVKTTKNGQVQWDKTIGGSSFDFGAVVHEIKKNHYAIGGTSYSGISGDKTVANRDKSLGTGDYWFVELKYVKPASTAITQIPTSRLAAPAQNSTTTFYIYPNPATTVLHIQNIGKASFILSDQSGKRMLTKTLEGNGDLNVVNIPAGNYYLTNTTTGATQKVIITK